MSDSYSYSCFLAARDQTPQAPSSAPSPANDDWTRVPGTDWERAKPEAMGFSSARLEALRAWVRTQPTAAMMVVVRGEVIFEYGDPRLISKVASVRNSILSMLYGNYVVSGKIDLNKSVKDLQLDDKQPFLPVEEHATLERLLASRSAFTSRTAVFGQDDLTRRPMPVMNMKQSLPDRIVG